MAILGAILIVGGGLLIGCVCVVVSISVFVQWWKCPNALR